MPYITHACISIARSMPIYRKLFNMESLEIQIQHRILGYLKSFKHLVYCKVLSVQCG